MADRYWVGGTANWDGTAGTKWATTSGGAGGASVPTSADDVFFTNLSTGTCTISAGNTGAKSITCTGFTGTLAGNNLIQISGNLTLSAGMTMTYDGTMRFIADATIISAGKTVNTEIDGAGITVTLGDAKAGGTLNITQGTFNTANYNLTCFAIVSTNSNTRTITLGSSTVTTTGGVNFTTSTNLTFNANTSNITVSSNTGTFAGGGQTFYNVSFTSAILAAAISGTNTFNNLTLAARTSTGISSFTLNDNQTINGTFTVQSGATDPTRRYNLRSNTFGTARTITSASNTIFGADFLDITAAGVASWSDSTRTGYWGDCQGNSGITFATGRSVYWNLSGTSSWSATGWALTNNGTPSVNNFPLAQDTATFTDSGSVTGTITFNAAWNIGSIDMSSRTSAMTLATSSLPVIFGNWTNGSGTTLSGSASITFAGRNTQTITCAGKSFSQVITINCIGSTVQLGDAFISSSNILHAIGTFNANNYNVTCATFASSNSNTRTITMGSGLWTLSGTGTVWNLGTTTNLTFNKDTANILLSDTSTTARTFSGGGLTYNKLTIGGATGTSVTTIQGVNTFSELASTKTVAHSIEFSNNNTITTWSITGSSGNLVTVNSDTAGTARTLTITNRTSGIDYLEVRNITAPLAPVTFYAGANSRIGRNTRGVAAIAPVANEYIYVLDTGTSWTVPSDWNSSNNEIHLFAGGGGGAGSRFTTPNGSGGAGGGGGGYTKVTNLTLTPSSSVSYAIGAAGTGAAAGADGGAGGNTTFNSGAYTTTGGGGGTGTATSSTSGAAGTGSTFNGGQGGQGSLSTVANTGNGGGGGGGAGGPLGTGANGGNGFASTTAANIAGGGGGGNGGGSAGGNATSGSGGLGGNNNAGVGGGTLTAISFNGGGSAGSSTATTAALAASCGVDIANAGMGGGSGGGGGGTGNPVSGPSFFGGGGGGGRLTTGNVTNAGAAGGQGGIIIWYSVGAAPAANGNFFFLFG